MVAQNIINRYLTLNNKTKMGLGLTELTDELTKALPNTLSTTELVQIVNEEAQRSDLQLARHYSQILSKDFEQYVAIVKPDLQPHEY